MEKDLLSILIVDRQERDQKLIGESLERSKVPAKIDFESSTSAALKRVQKKQYDLILTEHAPPRQNAFQLLQMTRKQARSVPVIVLARDGDAGVVREAFKRGAEDYVLKQELASISLFDVIGSAIERRRQKEEMQETQTRLRELAERDGLTGLYNHRTALEVLEKEFARCRRYNRPLSLMMLDLDGFKAINDTCGHLEGDGVLRKIATLLKKSVREVDLVARYGGDEFILLLPETWARHAIRLGQRIVREIRKNPLLYQGKIFPLSASVGITSFSPTVPSAGALLKEADEALYAAKRNGRAQVIYLKAIRGDEKENAEVPVRGVAVGQDMH